MHTFIASAAGLLLLLSCASPQQQLSGRTPLDRAAPGVRLDMTAVELMRRYPSAQFIAYSGYRITPVDSSLGLLHIDVFFDVDETPPSGSARARSVRGVGQGADIGRALAPELTEQFGSATDIGCSGVAAIGEDSTMAWRLDEMTLVLTIPITRRDGMRSTSRLLMVPAANGVTEILPEFVPGACPRSPPIR